MSMTVNEAYRIHRNAARNVGRGRGYTARRLDEALEVLRPFWAVHNSAYMTQETIDRWDRVHAEGGENDG